MTNLEKLRAMDARELAYFIDVTCRLPDFKKIMCSAKHCGYAEVGVCIGPVPEDFYCMDALRNWLSSEAEEGESELWVRKEKVTAEELTAREKEKTLAGKPTESGKEELYESVCRDILHKEILHSGLIAEPFDYGKLVGLLDGILKFFKGEGFASSNKDPFALLRSYDAFCRERTEGERRFDYELRRAHERGSMEYVRSSGRLSRIAFAASIIALIVTVANAIFLLLQ